jgi:LEA14-like dessication related protein
MALMPFRPILCHALHARHRGAVSLLALLLAACAAFGPRLEAPHVRVVSVGLDRIESANAWFVATVELTNPNARDIEVEALDATLAIEGQVVASAALVAPVHVPANGSALANIGARTGVDAILRAVASAMQRLGGAQSPGLTPSLRFVLDGTARLSNGLSVPFHRAGELGAQPAKPS